ncbi:membrane-bound PQQ-dependent dehydrogenase, glucose/quinate/shikimate family [Pseudoxanthomonas kalamensis DSM 18571]|uniref:membrane-bound PQQ-dependent dehydrogenase, glucose/quinate/shikimate family n=1 Tax=Pseudoxanthomonas kalamensis TaxID=289483 RepID=UPI001390AFFE|nr:membrane-bound PQQ-dependent dehydrogenase, glucose/quinate/shikimate family [Pseudoxanthomonas kalamensis]KAF1712050.1 membrane-bound PQQ-dependent dehydrogenase, glucose/quinate/shikimate family [Pseudoxanthomonas kalamensis DSM 18571]
MFKDHSPGKTARILLRAFGVALVLIGAVLAVGGLRLVALGGSWYYLIAGSALALSGILYLLRRPAGAWLYAAVFVGTVVWALWEVGLSFWPLVPRLAPVLVLALLAALLWPALRGDVRVQRQSRWLVAALGAILIVCGMAMFFPHGVTGIGAAGDVIAAPAASAPGNWQYYGRTPRGTRFTPAAQITPDNVDQLQVAWTFRTGEPPSPFSEDQNTPIQVGDSLYLCTPMNRVIALDADSGREKWRYDPQVADSQIWNRCRGVGYYEPAAVPRPLQATEDDTPVAEAVAADVPADEPATCRRRIVLTTVDARLIEIDADDGRVCADFGDNGEVDLKVGMGEIKHGYYFPTSMPTVAQNRVIVGGWVFDGRSVDEPSGVVRAFDADTGALVWAWDLGNPKITLLPPEGGTYTRGTPNVWSTPAFDEALGLIYLPTGNQEPDFWGGHRSPAADEYSSSVVALELATGRVRWKFQTTHHDLWDYDVPAQPALYDMPDGKGGTVPALVQVTKRGQIFVLDRRDGTPITEVAEKPVPQEHAEGDRVSPTQPYSVGMPAIGAQPLTEKMMWGATFFDQLACRIAFRKLRYLGDFSAPSTEPTLVYPGNFGGMNWGSVAIDESRGYLFVNDIRIPQVMQLIPRAQLDPDDVQAGHGAGSIYPMEGTPFAIRNGMFNSPLGVPCHAPPWGTYSAIDLNTQTLLWQRPAGSVRDVVVGGMHVTIPFEVGMPTLGGGVSTASGLVFHAGTQDYFLRALDIASGKELWKGRLPVGAQATPMSYVAPGSGRQYVVVSAGGTRGSPDRGDYVIAYALPESVP